MPIQIDGRTLVLSGAVGELVFGEGFTHAEVVAALTGLRGDVTVRVNSGGGYASEGSAIYSALASHPARVHVIIDGIAASAASLIAMAGDTITMSDGAVMMIHDPENVTFGNSADHAKTIEELEAYATAYAKVYAKRSGKTAAQCREIMKAETWYDGPQAVAAGFATAVGGERARAATAFDYSTYAHAPYGLAAWAKAQGWIQPRPGADAGVEQRGAAKAAENKAAWARVVARQNGSPLPSESAHADLWRRAASRIRGR